MAHISSLVSYSLMYIWPIAPQLWRPACCWMQDVQNKQAQAQKLLPAGAKRNIADFGNGFDHTTWKITHLGEADTATAKALDRGQNIATVNVNKHGNFRFKGTMGFALCV